MTAPNDVSMNDWGEDDTCALTGLVSPFAGWVTPPGADEAIEVEVIDLFGHGCRLRCRTRLPEGRFVGFRLGGSLYAEATVLWWRNGWADLRFAGLLRAAQVGAGPTGCSPPGSDRVSSSKTTE